MMLLDVFKVPTAVSLGVIATLIGSSIAASLYRVRRDAQAARGTGTARPGADDTGGPVVPTAPAPVS
jgi:hypothetical protein